MDLFLPEFGLVIWMTIAFGIVLFILSKFGFPVILKSINEREKYIIKSLEAAKEAQQKLEEIEQRGNEIINQAEKQQLSIVKETQDLKKKLLDEAKAEASKEAELMIANAKVFIEKEKEKALAEIKNEVLGLSINIAEKILANELSDKKAQTAYAERIVKDVIHS